MKDTKDPEYVDRRASSMFTVAADYAKTEYFASQLQGKKIAAEDVPERLFLFMCSVILLLFFFYGFAIISRTCQCVPSEEHRTQITENERGRK